MQSYSDMSSDRKKIVIGLSGGVDSAVAAARLKQEGWNVTGLFMKNWDEDDDEAYCAAREDLAAATAVSETIGISLKTVNFSHEYWERVFSTFLKEYQAGRTPNPDILCNREIKFKEFLSYAQMLGNPVIATGHYARIKNHKNGFGLHKSVDLSKDQSYFLHELDQTALAATIFPLGETNKTDVRAEAVSLGLPNAKRKDSTGICFIGERKFSDFLSKYLPPTPGDIKDLEGKTIGKHQGLWFYTLGQRQGLDIGGAGDAWYVAEKKMTENTLIVVQGHDHPSLLKQSVSVKKMHWTLKAPAQPRLKCFAKTRYRQDDQSCEVEIFPDGSLSATFEELQRAPTPGQSLVLYHDTQVLGGGVIEQVL